VKAELSALARETCSDQPSSWVVTIRSLQQLEREASEARIQRRGEAASDGRDRQGWSGAKVKADLAVAASSIEASRGGRNLSLRGVCWRIETNAGQHNAAL